jgi:uncharacterized protein YdeI (YjbR/CyaY-like superfamily)
VDTIIDHKGLPVADHPTPESWEQWLEQHGSASAGVWLRFAKKGAPMPSVAKADAIEVALSHGWIDGQLDKWDEHRWLVRFTPRGPRSKWSQINRATAERLIAEGRMQPAGLVQVEAAKADGRWDAAYAPQSTAEVPPDMQAALDDAPAAKAFFATLRGANRYAFIYRVQDAKLPATRAARIARFVAMLDRGEMLH